MPCCKTSLSCMPSIFRGFRRFFQNRKIDAANIENHLICIQLNRENSAKRENFMLQIFWVAKPLNLMHEKKLFYSMGHDKKGRVGWGQMLRSGWWRVGGTLWKWGDGRMMDEEQGLGVRVGSWWVFRVKESGVSKILQTPKSKIWLLISFF